MCWRRFAEQSLTLRPLRRFGQRPQLDRLSIWTTVWHGTVRWSTRTQRNALFRGMPSYGGSVSVVDDRPTLVERGQCWNADLDRAMHLGVPHLLCIRSRKNQHWLLNCRELAPNPAQPLPPAEIGCMWLTIPLDKPHGGKMLWQKTGPHMLKPWIVLRVSEDAGWRNRCTSWNRLEMHHNQLHSLSGRMRLSCWTCISWHLSHGSHIHWMV